jgi:hypothetical protein
VIRFIYFPRAFLYKESISGGAHRRENLRKITKDDKKSSSLRNEYENYRWFQASYPDNQTSNNKTAFYETVRKAKHKALSCS